MARVAVVGAGLAGLAAAAALARDGHEPVVFEARDRVGGRVWSVPYQGAIVERGAEFVMPENTTVRALAERLGLRLYEKGTPYGIREPRGGEPTTLARVRAGLAEIAAAGPFSGTVTEALEALVTDPAAREAILARIEISSTGPGGIQDAITLGESIGAAGEFPTWTVEGGNQRLATGLAAELPDDARLSTPVDAIARTADGVRVHAAGAELEAAACVLAVPPARVFSIRFDPVLPDETLRALAGVRLGQAAKLFLPLAVPAEPSAVLAVPERFWTFTGLGPGGQPLPVCGSFAGTAMALERLRIAAGPETWIERVRALRPDLTLGDEPPLLATWHDDPWAGGSYSLATYGEELQHPALREPVGRIAFAGEHTAGEFHAQMEGALRSGERAAADVLALL